MSIPSLLFKSYIRFKEKKYGNKLRYIFNRNHSESLLVVFSGFSPGNVRKYNYIKSFRNLAVDKLYILDTYAYRGSYYLFDEGSDYPQREVQSLINVIIHKYNYKHTFYAGSSKGGSAALFYGIKNKATKVFSGACQYNIGDYLYIDKHRDIFLSMMGAVNPPRSKEILNNVVRRVIRENKGSNTKVYLLYSREEPTYDEEIIDLKHDLIDNSYDLFVKEELFTDHGDVGKFFPSFVIDNLKV